MNLLWDKQFAVEATVYSVSLSSTRTVYASKFMEIKTIT